MIITIEYKNKVYSNFSIEQLLSAGIPESVVNKEVFNALKNHKLLTINQHCQVDLNSLTNTYPAGEVSTFDKQETEARAYLADNAAATPLLDALATGRGIDKAELINRVIAKADVFSAASGAIIGKRQKLEDALNALSEETHSTEDIAAIIW